MAEDITPKYNILSSAEVPGNILDASNDPAVVTPFGTMVQPKPTSDSLGGLYAGASEVTQGGGNNIFKASTLGIHLGAANFVDAPFSVDMAGNIIAVSGTIGNNVLTATSLSSSNFTTGVSGYRLNSVTGDAEFNQGTFRGTFILGGSLITVSDINDLQDAIDDVNNLGGGTVAMTPDTYIATSSFTVPSGVTFDMSGAIIDFGGGAYQILIEGTNTYSTGTLAVNYASGSVTGTGTTWTAAMVGRSILIGDYWYEITARASDTAITISPVFRAPNVTGATYVIATTVNDVAILNGILQNASGTLLKFRYVNGIAIDGLTTTAAGQGIDGDDSANLQFLGSQVDTCTVGMTLDNVPYCSLDNFGILDISGGTGLALTNIPNSAIGAMSIQNVTGVGVKFTNCFNLGLINYSIIECSSHGIEFVSGNRDVDIESGYTDTVGGDAIKLTATSDNINIDAQSLYNYTGYGINIAAATCDKTKVGLISYGGGGSGTISDSGTGTVILGDDTAYNATTWNGNLGTATKNAIRDKFESLTSTSKCVMAWCKNTVSSNIGGAATRYIQFFNNEDVVSSAPAGTIVPFAGTIKNLYVRTGNNASALSDNTITVFKNGSSTALTITLAPTDDNVVVSDTTHSFSVVAGDLLYVDLTSATNAFAIHSVSVELDAT